MFSLFKHEKHRLTFRHLDGSLIYPGVTVLTWARVGSVWHLIGMTPLNEFSDD